MAILLVIQYILYTVTKKKEQRLIYWNVRRQHQLHFGDGGAQPAVTRGIA
jgi:hypothetical protein